MLESLFNKSCRFEGLTKTPRKTNSSSSSVKFLGTPFFTEHLRVAGFAHLVGKTLCHCKKMKFSFRISSANVTIKCKCNHFICKQILVQSLLWCSICLNISEAIAKLYFCKLLLCPVSYRCASYQYDKLVTINYLTTVEIFYHFLH